MRLTAFLCAAFLLCMAFALVGPAEAVGGPSGAVVGRTTGACPPNFVGVSFVAAGYSNGVSPVNWKVLTVLTKKDLLGNSLGQTTYEFFFSSAGGSSNQVGPDLPYCISAVNCDAEFSLFYFDAVTSDWKVATPVPALVSGKTSATCLPLSLGSTGFPTLACTPGTTGVPSVCQVNPPCGAAVLAPNCLGSERDLGFRCEDAKRDWGVQGQFEDHGNSNDHLKVILRCGGNEVVSCVTHWVPSPPEAEERDIQVCESSSEQGWKDIRGYPGEATCGFEWTAAEYSPMSYDCVDPPSVI